MPVELVFTFAADGLRLDGALHTPAPVNRPAAAAVNSGIAASTCIAVSTGVEGPIGIDGLIVLHGTGSNFYASRFLTYLAERAVAWRIPCAVVNTRGHDQIAAALVVAPDGSMSSRTIGSAYERVDECRLDVRAWVDVLRKRGCRRIGVLGHSLGAVKAVYAVVTEPLADVAALVAVSPPRLSYAHFAASPRGPGFLEEAAVAEAHVAAGRPDELMAIRFPIPYVITAAGYLDKYGPAETYNLLNHVDRLPVPTLFTFGGTEVQQGIAFRGFPEALEEARARGANLKTAVIAGGDHQYTGVQPQLVDTIERWLRKPAATAEPAN